MKTADPMEKKGTDCIVIGAGITGLTAAYYLAKENADYLVLEEKPRVGGVIRTHCEEGFVFESGPNTGVLGQPEAAMLFEDLGDKVDLEIASAAVKKRYILKNGRWHALPSGLKEAIRTPLFTLGDKLRILGEPFRRRGGDPHETLDRLVRRRMGRSFLEYAVDPFILGVYAGDPASLVPKYALPKLYNLEQEYGSFIGGAVKKKLRKDKSEEEKKATREVFSVKGGLQSVVDALYRESGPGRFILEAGEIQIRGKEKAFEVSFVDASGKKQVLKTHTVIVTTGSHSLPGLLPGLKGPRMEQLTDLRYAQVIEVAVGFERWEGMELDGFGGLIPYRENRDLLGILFLSAFLEDRAPPGGALFTLFTGGVRRPELFDQSDEEVREMVAREFTRLMGVDRFDPRLFRIFRHRWAIPQYEVSSGRRFETIQELEREMPGLLLRGNFQGGIGLADRIRQGRIAAEQVTGNP